MKKYRKNLFCNICDYANKLFFNNETKTIQYKELFCNKLIEDILPIADMQFTKLVPLMLLT